MNRQDLYERTKQINEKLGLNWLDDKRENFLDVISSAIKQQVNPNNVAPGVEPVEYFEPGQVVRGVGEVVLPQPKLPENDLEAVITALQLGLPAVRAGVKSVERGIVNRDRQVLRELAGGFPWKETSTPVEIPKNRQELLAERWSNYEKPKDTLYTIIDLEGKHNDERLRDFYRQASGIYEHSNPDQFKNVIPMNRQPMNLVEILSDAEIKALQEGLNPQPGKLLYMDKGKRVLNDYTNDLNLEVENINGFLENLLSFIKKEQ